MRVLIIGCGYVGTTLGQRLVEGGHEVWGIRRSPAAGAQLKACGIEPVLLDISRKTDFANLSASFNWVVNTASSSGGGLEDYRRIYFEGTRNVLDWLQSFPPQKYLYTSSTSVYGQTDGSAVKESSPTEPNTETGRVLLETEKLLMDAFQQRKFPAVILRVAGIYGPDRTHLLQKFIQNQVKLSGQGDRFLNMIHRDDLVSLIVGALKNGRPGEIYNAVDDEPVTELHFYRWLAESIGKWLPPHGGNSDTTGKRSGTNKRVQNRKMKMELGMQCQYPTFRQGYTAELTRLERAGALDIQPEAR